MKNYSPSYIVVGKMSTGEMGEGVKNFAKIAHVLCERCLTKYRDRQNK